MKTLITGIVVYETSDWGARPPTEAFESKVPTDMVVHHMDWPNRALIPDHAAAVQKAFEVAQQCQIGHMSPPNNWADTGQHFTVTREGIILEGRHGSLDALLAGHCVRGAHAADDSVSPPVNDNNSWGVEHEGTYTTQGVPLIQWVASVKLFAAIAYYSKLDTATIKGHRDTGCSTACPGDWFESHLSGFRAQVHALKVGL